MKKQIAMLLLPALVAGTALAQGSNDGAFYAGLEGGDARFATFNVVPGFSKTSETSNVGAWRVSLGYQIDPNFGLELGYFATGNFKHAAVAADTSTYEAKMRVQGVDLAAVYKLTQVLPGWFVKGGVSRTSLKATTTGSYGTVDAESVGESISGTGYLLGVGYDFRLGESWDARLAYSRYGHAGGAIDSNLNLYSAGLMYRF